MTDHYLMFVRAGQPDRSPACVVLNSSTSSNQFSAECPEQSFTTASQVLFAREFQAGQNICMTGQAKTAATVSLRHHKRTWGVCCHQQREEIESAFIGWRSPASIADEWACRPGELVKDIVLPVRARVSVQIGTGKSSLARRGSGEQCEKAIHE
jgi:hypothetical protein